LNSMARPSGTQIPQKLAHRDVVWAEHPVPVVKSAAGAGWDRATEFPARESGGLREQGAEMSRRAAAPASGPAGERGYRNGIPTSPRATPRIPRRLRRSRAGTNAAARHNAPETPVVRD